MFTKGEYTSCRCDICEILIDDELFCTVTTPDAEIIIDAVKENLLMKGFLDVNVGMGDYSNCQCDICEIVKGDDVFCSVAACDVDLIIGLLEENLYFRKVF